MVHPLPKRAHPARRVGERLSPHAGRRPGGDRISAEVAADNVGTSPGPDHYPDSQTWSGAGTGAPVGYRDKAREAGEAWTYPGGAIIVQAVGVKWLGLPEPMRKGYIYYLHSIV